MGELQRQIGARAQAAAEVERLKAKLAATQEALNGFLQQPEPPLVLSLPEVPEGAALVGERSGQRFTVDPEERGKAVWTNGSLSRWTMGQLLDHEGSVRVEMAPPRTWPKLDDPEGIASALEVEGHGRFVVCVRRELGNTTFIHEDDVDEHGVQRGLAWTLGRLRELGEVREVIEP